MCNLSKQSLKLCSYVQFVKTKRKDEGIYMDYK